MKKIIITMILTLVLALTTTMALAGNSGSSDFSARLEEKINSCELDVHNILASAGNSSPSNLTARVEEKISSCETDLHEMLKSAEPQKVRPGEIFQIDPQMDEAQKWS